MNKVKRDIDFSNVLLASFGTGINTSTIVLNLEDLRIVYVKEL